MAEAFKITWRGYVLQTKPVMPEEFTLDGNGIWWNILWLWRPGFTWTRQLAGMIVRGRELAVFVLIPPDWLDEAQVSGQARIWVDREIWEERGLPSFEPELWAALERADGAEKRAGWPQRAAMAVRLLVPRPRADNLLMAARIRPTDRVRSFAMRRAHVGS